MPWTSGVTVAPVCLSLTQPAPVPSPTHATPAEGSRRLQGRRRRHAAPPSPMCRAGPHTCQVGASHNLQEGSPQRRRRRGEGGPPGERRHSAPETCHQSGGRRRSRHHCVRRRCGQRSAGGQRGPRSVRQAGAGRAGRGLVNSWLAACATAAPRSPNCRSSRRGGRCPPPPNRRLSLPAYCFSPPAGSVQTPPLEVVMAHRRCWGRGRRWARLYQQWVEGVGEQRASEGARPQRRAAAAGLCRHPGSPP